MKYEAVIGLEVHTELQTTTNIFCLGFISLPRMMMNVAIRFTVRVMPNWVRGLIYKKMLRK